MRPALLLVLAAATLGVAEGQVRSDVKIIVDQPFRDVPMDIGWVPVVVEAQNADDEAHEIEIEIDGHNDRVLRRLNVAAGETGRVEVPVPVAREWGNMRLRVTSDLDGRIHDGSIDFQRKDHGWGYSGHAPSKTLCVLTQTDLPALSLPGSTLGPGGSRTRTTRRGGVIMSRSSSRFGEFHPVQIRSLPSAWICLTGIDFLAADAAALVGLSAEERAVVSKYVTTGGNCIIYEASRLGPSELAAMFPGTDTAARGEVRRVGMGAILVEDDAIDDWEEERWQAAFEGFKEPGALQARWLARQRLGFSGFGMAFHPRMRSTPEIPGLADVPVRAFAILIILFAVLVGPANYFWLKKRGKQALLVFTIPLISLGAVVLLTGFAVLDEGLDVKLVPRTMTWINQVDHRAVKYSRSGYFASLTPADGMRFDVDTAVFPTGLDRIFGRGMRRTESVADWTHGLALTGGWLPPRVPTELFLVQEGVCRQRLEISGPVAHELEVTNGLDANIDVLIVHVAEGIYYGLENLGSGKRGTAGPVSLPEARTMIEGAIDADLWKKRPPMSDSLPIPVGEYSAVVDRDVFANHGIDDPRRLPGIHLLRGRYRAGGR